MVIRSSRTTSRQRPPARATGLGPNSAASGAAPRTAVTRRRSSTRRRRAEREVELQLGVADATEAGEQPGADLVGLGLARRRRRAPASRPAAPVAVASAPTRPSGSVRPTSCASKHAAQAPSVGSSPASARSCSTTRPGAGDVARRQRALARGGEQLGPCASRRRRAAARARGGRARPRPRGRPAPSARSRRGRTAARRRADRAGHVVVDAPELRPVPVRLLVVERDHGLVLADEVRPRLRRSTPRPARAGRRAWS